MNQFQSILATFCLSFLLSSCSALVSPTSTRRAFAPATAMTAVTSSTTVTAMVAATSTTCITRERISMMPATLERQDVRRSMTAGPALLERPTTTERPNEAQPNKQRKNVNGDEWEVRIYNDGLNTREYVARALANVVGMTEIGAYQTMMHAHKTGIAAVGRWAFEIAELYHEGLKQNGIHSDLVPVDESS